MPRRSGGSLSDLLKMARLSTSPRHHSAATITTGVLTCDSLNSSAHGDACTSDVSLSVVASWSAESFVFRRLLGHGSFGEVWLADYNPEGSDMDPQQFAVKKIPKVYGEKRYDSILQEKQILQNLGSSPCPFIVQLLGTCQSHDELFFVFDVVECGDLWNVIYTPDSRLPPELILFYAFGILLGLEHIHSRSIVYRDLKPENVTIDKNGYPKIIDLGLARSLAPGEMRKTLCGTPEYVAPEIVLCGSGNGYSYAVDLWAFGVVLYEMVMKRTPFAGKTSGDLTQLFTNICHVQKCGIVLSATKVDARSGNTPHARELMTKLFSGAPALRYCGGTSPGGLLEHPYFASAPFSREELTLRQVKAPRLQPVYVGGTVEAGKAKDSYTGDQAIFADF